MTERSSFSILLAAKSPTSDPAVAPFRPRFVSVAKYSLTVFMSAKKVSILALASSVITDDVMLTELALIALISNE